MELRGNLPACLRTPSSIRSCVFLALLALFLWITPAGAGDDPATNSGDDVNCTVVTPGAGVLQQPTGGSGDPDDYDLMPEGNTIEAVDDPCPEIVGIVITLAEMSLLTL